MWISAVRVVVVIVRLDDPEPFDSEAGENEHSAAAGRPVQENVTWPLNPLMGATVMVAVPELPAMTVNEVGELVTEKPAPVPVTVSVTGTLAVNEVEVPVTTIAKDPVGVELVVAIVS